MLFLRKYKKKVLRAGSRKKKTKNRKVKRVVKGGWGMIKPDELTGGGQWKITSGISSIF